MIIDIKERPEYKYAMDVTQNKIVAGKYIKKSCENFLKDINDENCKYFLDLSDLKTIIQLTKLINMATGLKVGVSAYDALAGFQWFFIVNALCWKHKDNPKKRRFEKSVLLIARKSGKSFLVGLIFCILLIIEPQYSEFYSVAPDRELSSIVKKELEQIILSSPLIEKHFEIVRGEIRCRITKSKFIPLACSENRMDGRKANVFVADEVGALRTRYPIDAMESSQMSMVNRTGILISTAYESLNNPMTQEVEYCKKVLDGIVDDDTLFGLLYEPDDKKDWTSDKSTFEANPLAIDIEENYKYLLKQRNAAIEMPEKRKNFITKHMNIFVDGDESEVYISSEDVKKCRIPKFDWKGRKVYVGVDLSLTTDNTAISMVTYDIDKKSFVCQAWGFVPTDNVEYKSRIERIDYITHKKNGDCFFCGDKTISYSFVEDFVFSLEQKYGVRIIGIGFDRYNCISSANKWATKFDTIEIKQHSSVMHPATKLLKESILSGKFSYINNKLLELNFSNARETKDTNLNTYVNKKKSTGKVDLVVATINAMVLWNKEIEEGKSIYEERDIIIL